MKIPIIVKATSKCISPSVYLLPGSWIIKTDHINSRVSIGLSNNPVSMLVTGDKIIGDQLVKVEIEEMKDKSITVYAESCLSQ